MDPVYSSLTFSKYQIDLNSFSLNFILNGFSSIIQRNFSNKKKTTRSKKKPRQILTTINLKRAIDDDPGNKPL